MPQAVLLNIEGGNAGTRKLEFINKAKINRYKDIKKNKMKL